MLWASCISCSSDSTLQPQYKIIFLLDPILLSLSRTEEPAKVGTCARDRRALQQLALT